MSNDGIFRIGACAWAVAAMVGGAACDLLGAQDIRTTIHAGHHGARIEDGTLPDYGAPEKPRNFTNDLGWRISLLDGFVVTTGVKIASCDGETHELPLPFGPLPEYWLDEDMTVTPFAAMDLPPGSYCQLVVEFGRYRGEVAAMAESEPFPVHSIEYLEGTTIMLTGRAERDDGAGGVVSHFFKLRSEEIVVAALEIDELGPDKTPWEITGDEAGDKDISVLKTYDQFFKGVDFDTYDPATLEAALPRLLLENTRVIDKTAVY